MTSLRHIAQAFDSTVVRKMPAEPLGAAKIFQFHCKTNILHSVLTLKSRIQVIHKGASMIIASTSDLYSVIANEQVAKKNKASQSIASSNQGLSNSNEHIGLESMHVIISERAKLLSSTEQIQDIKNQHRVESNELNSELKMQYQQNLQLFISNAQKYSQVDSVTPLIENRAAISAYSLIETKL